MTEDNKRKIDELLAQAFNELEEIKNLPHEFSVATLPYEMRTKWLKLYNTFGALVQEIDTIPCLSKTISKQRSLRIPNPLLVVKSAIAKIVSVVSSPTKENA